MTNRASLAILLLVVMPTVAQAQTEFEGTFRCTMVDAMKAFQPDGRLHPVEAGSFEEKELIPPFRNFTVNVGKSKEQDIGGRTWITVHTATEQQEFLAVQRFAPLITLHVRTYEALVWPSVPPTVPAKQTDVPSINGPIYFDGHV
jgi:hypothetical protein